MPAQMFGIGPLGIDRGVGANLIVDYENTGAWQVHEAAIEKIKFAIYLIRRIGGAIVCTGKIAADVRVIRILLVGYDFVYSPCTLPANIVLVGVHVIAEVVEIQCVLGC